MTQHSATNPVVWTDAEGLVVGGYDVVAYHADGRAVKGKADHEVDLQGVRYRFASREHLDAFLAEPARYLPAYGGYCAFAMGARNALVEPDPETFRIVEGCLMLFFHAPYEGQVLDTSKLFDQDPQGFVEQAEHDWPDAARG